MHQMLRFIVMLAFALPSLALAQADLRQPSGKEWLTIGGDWSNSRYSTLTLTSSTKNAVGLVLPDVAVNTS